MRALQGIPVDTLNAFCCNAQEEAAAVPESAATTLPAIPLAPVETRTAADLLEVAAATRVPDDDVAQLTPPGTFGDAVAHAEPAAKLAKRAAGPVKKDEELTDNTYLNVFSNLNG